MIRVKLKSHATLKTIIGQDNFNVSVPEGSTVSEVLAQVFKPFHDRLEQRYGPQGTQDLFKSIVILLNGVQGSLEAKIKENDQIDILDLIPGG